MENRASFPKPFPLAFVSENINNAFEIIASYHSRHDLAENSSLGIAQQTLTHIFKGHTSRMVTDIMVKIELDLCFGISCHIT